MRGIRCLHTKIIGRHDLHWEIRRVLPWASGRLASPLHFWVRQEILCFTVGNDFPEKGIILSNFP